MTPVTALERTPSSALVEITATRLGEGLRSLLLFGSHLDARSAARGVPDLLALVDDGQLAAVLRRLGCGPLLRWLASRLPPITLALHDQGRIVAKLNLLESRVAASQLEQLPDLYLAGRLSKRTQLIYARGDDCQRELEAITEAAAQRVAQLVVRDLPRRCSLDQAARACIAISYRAEVRPEGPIKLRALYDCFGDFYARRFAPLLIDAAAARGVHFEPTQAILVDDRDESERQRDRAELLWFLRRCQLRAMLRWPKQMLCYRGWLKYVVEKRRRAHRQEARA